MITEYNKFFNFFKKKKKNKKLPKNNDLEFYNSKIDLVKDALLELSDEGYDISVNIDSLNRDEFSDPYYNLNPDITNQILVSIINKNDTYIDLNNVMESFRFLNDIVIDNEMSILRYNLYISGYYDNANYMGDQYYDDIPQLEYDLDKEATKFIEFIHIMIVKS